MPGTTRTATLDYRTTGAERSTGQVISLADALERQARSANTSAAAADKAAASHQKMGLVTKTATDDVLRFGNALGPVGIGLAQIAVEGPRAIAALLGTGQAAQRASAYHRLLNTSILAGTGAMATGAVVAGAYVKHLIEQGDAYQSLSAKIKIYTAGAVEASNVQAQLFRSSREARQGVEDQTRLFQRLSPALADSGRGPQDAVRVANLVGKALTIQGATGQEATYGAIDLIHALGTGQLQGRQLRGLETEFPTLLRYIAANLQGPNGKPGVPYGALTEMAKNGQLSSDKILDALLKAEPQINKDFVEAPKTAQQAWQAVSDQIMRAVGQTMQVTGTQSGLYNWLQSIATKADEFRQKLLMDPQALRPLEDGARVIGDMVGSIAHLGGEAAAHFDDIVRLGELVIALKLGEVMAGWFSRTATAARAAIGDAATFIQRARYAAGAAAAPTSALAAGQLRDVSTQLDAQAATKAAEANVRAARAAAARAAADEAVARATTLEATGTAEATAVAKAYADAEALAARALSERAAAGKAATAAAALQTRAAAAAAVALEAEAVVTREVTLAQTAMNVAAQAGGAVLSFVGGWVGLVGIALGGLAFAWEQAREANRKHVDEMQRSVVVSERLKALTDELTSATWNQIPALEAQARAARGVAEANRQKLQMQLNSLQAERAGVAAEGAGSEAEARGQQMRLDSLDRQIGDLRRVVGLGTADKAAQDVQAQRETAVILARTVEHLNDLLGRGLDERGAPLSAAARSSLEAQRAGLKQQAQAGFDAYAGKVAGANTPAARQALAAIQDIYSEAAVEATPRLAVKFGDGKKDKGRGAIDSALKAALDDLFQEQGFSENLQSKIAGTDRYQVRGDKVFNATTGQPFSGGKDEAAAAAKFLETVKLIRQAKPEELLKFGDGKSKDQLIEASEQMLQYKVATSSAAKADEDWSELKKRLGIESDEEAKATYAVNKFLTEHTQKTYDDAQAVQAYAAMIDRAAEAEKALAAAKPIYDAQHRIADETTAPAKGESRQAQIDRIRQVNLQASSASAAEIVRKTAEAAEKEPFKAVDLWKKADDQIASLRVLSATKTAEDLAKIEEDELKRRQQFEQQYSKEAEGALHDLVFGGSASDFGKRIGDDLLEAIYERLIGSPFRKLIQAELDKVLTPSGGISGSGIGSIFSDIAQFLGFGGGTVQAASIATSADFVSTPATLASAAAALGLADGAVGIVRGPGGPRSDSIIARVSNGESIINAESTRQYYPLLKAINDRTLPRFADGGFVGPTPSTSLLTLGLPSGFGPHLTYAPTFHAQNADAQGLADLRKQSDEQFRQFQVYARKEGERWVQYAQAAGVRPSR